MVKLKLVKSCVNSSTTYACDGWGSCSLISLEVLQRKSLKIALSVRKNIPNEVLYAESGCMPLKAIIYRWQLKFYRKKMKADATNDPYSPSTSIFNNTVSTNIQFTPHYNHLNETFANEIESYNVYEYQCKYTAIEKVRQKGSADPDIYFGPYLKINLDIDVPEFYQRQLS